MPAYPKTKQLTKRKKKTAKDRGKISKETYQLVLKRDKYKCALCNSKVGLECHHVKSRSNGGEGIVENLIMLCKFHHYVKLHGQGDFETKKSIFDYMISLGYDFDKDLLKLISKNNQMNRRKQDGL